MGRALGDMKENRGQTESVANIGPVNKDLFEFFIVKFSKCV